MRYDAEIEKIEGLLESAHYSSQEKERARREIAVVRERLEKREYTRCSYVTNKLNIPERMEDFFAEILFYSGVGRTWERLFRGLDLSHQGTVLDLCPGLGPKVELGLFYAGFEGEITVVDKDPHSLARLNQFFSIFNPPCTIRQRCSDLFAVRGRFNVVVGNHILDDLILDAACPRFGVNQADVYESEALLKEVWTKALAIKGELDAAVVPRLAGFLARTAGSDGRIILAQYPSYVERVLEMRELTLWMRSLLRKMSVALERYEFLPEREAVAAALKGKRGAFGPDEVLVMRRRGNLNVTITKIED